MMTKVLLTGTLVVQMVFGTIFLNPGRGIRQEPSPEDFVQAAQRLHVPEQVGDLQTAINQVANGGIIEVAPGTYSVPVGGLRLNNLHKSFTIRAEGGGRAILDGGGAGQILRFQNRSLDDGGHVTFEGLTFTRGRSDTGGLAAGVTVMNAKATFINTVFSDNYATSNGVGGGVLVAENSTALFINSVWQNNTAGTHGAGMAIATHSRVYIHNSQFLNNRVNLPGHTSYSAGGGIHLGNSVLRVSNTRFEGNQAGYVGGGLFAIGTWGDPWVTDVIVSNSTFINNHAISDPSVNLPSPTEGGGMHLEAQASGKVYNSRFITNTAESGGAITVYLASLIVDGGIFLGNRAVGTSKGGYGGAISGNSNDTPSDGGNNRTPANITVLNSYFQGRYNDVTTVALGGGAIFLAGDYNRQNGTGGVSKMGGVAENRAPLSISNSAFVDLDVSKPDNGNGGAIYVGLVDLNLSGSIVVKSDTNGTYGSGGAVMLIAQARGQVANSVFAKNTSSNFGGAFHSDGAELNITGSKLFENTAAKYGGGIFASSNSNTQSGVVSDNLISNNAPQNVFDDDRTNGPNNQMVYNNNTFFGNGGASALVYTNNLPSDSGGGAKTVSQLNTLVVSRANGSSTDKSTVDNHALSNAPVSGGLLAAPAGILQSGAPGDSIPLGAYLTYAWTGGTAKLDGSTLAGGAGAALTGGAGEHVLSVGGDNFDASVALFPLPAANFSASGNGPAYTLNWSVTSGTFLEAIIGDPGLVTTNSSGSVSVTPPAGDQSYYFYTITKEGGTAVLASTGTPALAAPDSKAILVGLNLPDNHASIQIANTGGGTLQWTATSKTPNLIQVKTPSGQTTGLASVVFSINPSGLAPGASQGSIEISAGAAGSKTVVISLIVVNDLKRTFYPLILR